MLNILAIEKSYLLQKIDVLQKIDINNIKAEELNAVVDAFSKNAIMRIENGIAYIDIFGELVNKTNWLAQLFGYKQTLYSDISKSLHIAKQDPSVESVKLVISSPGGQVSGLMNIMNEIAAFDKPIESVVDLCCSAAYFIASQTDKITAANKLSMIGSVGVLASFLDDTEYMKKLGVKDIVITSTDAPNKYADPATKKGYDIIQLELDAIHNVLVGEVSARRNQDISYINANYGKGGVFLAEKALEVKMIDGIKIAKTQEYVSASGNASTSPVLESNEDTISSIEMEKKYPQEEKSMDLKELQANSPELYSSVFEMGIKAERARIEELNGWAKANPETADIVSQAITQGKSATQIMPELIAATKTGYASVKTAEKESPEALAQVEANAHIQKEDKKDEVDVDAIAKSIAQSIF